jgi:group I intron endonuclease
MRLCGIYKIVNIVNGKYYLGSSDNMKNRWKKHLYDLRHNKHHSIHLQRAWNKHGENNFVFQIVEEVKRSILLEREQYHLDTFTPWNESIGYNVSKSACGGDLISYHPNIEEIREKQKVNTTNRWNNLSDDEKEKYCLKMKGDGNPNWKGGISHIKFKCPICGKETKTKTTLHKNPKSCNQCRDRDGSNNPFFGKEHTEETKNKLRVINLGKIISEDTKNKCREASNNFYNSERGMEYRKELSDKISGENHPLYGVGHTEQSKIKMSMTKKQKFISMTPEQKIDKIINSKANIKMVLAEGLYFFNCRDAASYYKKSTASINFRCNSKDSKWDNFKYIDKSYVINNKNDIIENIKSRLEAESSDVVDN